MNVNECFLLSLCQSLVASDPMDVRNARNAVIEALPHMLSSMALLWGVVMREEFQWRASDTAQSSRHTSTSVYFKSTKVCFKAIHVSFVLYVLSLCDVFNPCAYINVADFNC